VVKMGVMKCDRNGCDEILCSYYSREYGYICGECKSELERYCDIHGLSHESINKFMKSEKHSYIDEETTIDDIFKMSD
jgi:hypothetical protein